MPDFDAPPVVPLWVNGRAFLTVTREFQDVIDGVSGGVVRRTPLCGVSEVRLAVEGALQAGRAWAEETEEVRANLLHGLGESLSANAGHVARIIAGESGKSLDAAEREVAASIRALQERRGCEVCSEAEVGAVIGGAVEPLFGALALAIPPLLRGASVVFRPSPETPSALLIFAELSGRCAFPAGIINIVHGAESVVESLRAAACCVVLDSRAESLNSEILTLFDSFNRRN